MAGKAFKIMPLTISKIRITNCFLLLALKNKTVAIETKTKSQEIIILIKEGFAFALVRALYLKIIKDALNIAEMKKLRYVLNLRFLISNFSFEKHKIMTLTISTISI